MSRKKPNYAFFRDREKYIFATGESPNGTENVLAIIWEGAAPDSLIETARGIKQLQALERIEPAAVPLEWWNGFAKTTGRLPKREPPPEPPAPPSKQPEPKEPQEPQEPLAEIVIVALIIATALGLLIWQ